MLRLRTLGTNEALVLDEGGICTKALEIEKRKEDH